MFALMWERNVPAFQNVIPDVDALRRAQEQATGTFAQQIKALDPNSMLLTDIVKKAR